MDLLTMALKSAFKLNTKETRSDVVLVWRCPKCEDVRSFVFVHFKADFTMVGASLGAPTVMTDLQCVECGYEFKVPPSEKDLVFSVGELTNSMQTGAVSVEEYVNRLRAFPARFMRSVISLTDEWACPKCSEMNPATFDSCWNCQSKARAVQADVPEGGQSIS